MKNFRHEYKYLISSQQKAILLQRAKLLMKLDENVGDSGKYLIRSLYFDDLDNSCFYENENGVDPREKFRIRIYNGSNSIIKLENKRKRMQMTQKHSCHLSYEFVNDIIQMEHLNYPEILPNWSKLFLNKVSNHYFRPIIIVEYERIPFVYRLGNVRITFDDNISSSSDIYSFFNDRLTSRPIMPCGFSLMEVKFDDFIPDFIFRGLQLDGLQQTTFSKYYLCRKYSL